MSAKIRTRRPSGPDRRTDGRPVGRSVGGPLGRIIGASTLAAALGATAACGTEDAPVGQPAPTSTVSTAVPTVSAPTPSPGRMPNPDCPETITAVRSAVDKAVWGKGAAESPFQPVSVTICKYEATATGDAYATVSGRRTGKAATDLLALVNAGKPAAAKPNYCTQELGPTYVARFTDNERAVLSYAAETYGCHRLVATSFEGQGKPGDLASPRLVTPALVKSLSQR